MEYLWPSHQLRLHATAPVTTGAKHRVSRNRLSILLVPVILLIAVLCIPLPFPTGLPLIALALSVLLNQSRRARVFYVRTKRRLPRGSRYFRWFDTIDRLIRVKRRKAASRQAG